ncbi:MAG: D-alanyl-D-alanine carboxypeptidase/D-alanyl-D-alanine-endopeptidase [Aquabacterium sp.]
MPAAVDALLAASGLPRESFGLLVTPALGKPLPLLELHAGLPLQLASTAKLVTTYAALDLLGPQYRWRTYAFLQGPMHEGRLLGDLMIVGGGDAMLHADDLLGWFTRMRLAGLQEVLGDIVLDRSLFRLTEADHSRTPTPSADRPHHARPDALVLHGGGLKLPPPTSGRGLKQPPLPPPFDDQTARIVLALWRGAGLRVRGRVVDRRESHRNSLLPLGPDGEPMMPWSQHVSKPLPVLVHEINKRSDNLPARHLMLSLSPGFPLKPATLASARLRLERWLRLQGIADGEIELDNGSGLARNERGTPRALAQLLRLAVSGRHGEVFIDSLPLAGVDGTLQHRLTAPGVRGKARLKTGTLLDTRALAGYVDDSRGRRHVVVLLAQHPQAERAVPALDGIVEWVTRQA